MVVVFVAVSIVSVGYSYEMPDDVKRFLDNYVKDSMANDERFLRFKKEGIVPKSVKIKDLRLRALQVYDFNPNIFLDEYPDTVALSEIIRPTNIWRVLVMAHNKPLYQLLLERRDGKLRFTSSSFPSPGSAYKNPMWISLLETYPESTGINPVFVSTDLVFLPSFGRGYRFLYFQQKGPRKVHYIKRGETDPLSTLFTGSMENLDDSRIFIEYCRKKGISSIGELCTIERLKRGKINSTGRDKFPAGGDQ